MLVKCKSVNLIPMFTPNPVQRSTAPSFQCNGNVWCVCGDPGGGGTPYVMGDTYVPRFWPPFFTLAGSSTIFLGYFSHPPTAKLSFGVQKLPIFTKIDLFGPKFNFFLDLFGSNFQRPAAHPHQFSGRVPPRGGDTASSPRPRPTAQGGRVPYLHRSHPSQSPTYSYNRCFQYGFVQFWLVRPGPVPWSTSGTATNSWNKLPQSPTTYTATPVWLNVI